MGPLCAASLEQGSYQRGYDYIVRQDKGIVMKGHLCVYQLCICIAGFTCYRSLRMELSIFLFLLTLVNMRFCWAHGQRDHSSYRLVDCRILLTRCLVCLCIIFCVTKLSTSSLLMFVVTQHIGNVYFPCLDFIFRTLCTNHHLESTVTFQPYYFVTFRVNIFITCYLTIRSDQWCIWSLLGIHSSVALNIFTVHPFKFRSPSKFKNLFSV